MGHDDVYDQTTFARYVSRLRAELDDARCVANWENLDLRTYLEAIAAWANDWREPADSNPWRHAAGILAAASVYE